VTLHIAEFKLGPHHCALTLDRVQEVLRIVAVTPLPQAPPFIEGVLDLRGHVLPVVDLRARFGLPSRPYDDATHVLVAPLRGHPAALIVDEVLGVSLIDKSHMGIDPSLELGLDIRCLSRVVQQEGRLCLVLDLDKIFSEAEGAEFDAAHPARRTS